MTAVEADLRAAGSLQNNDWIITLIDDKMTFYFDINATIQMSHAKFNHTGNEMFKYK